MSGSTTPDWQGPLLLGAMAGAMVAARFETAILCLLVALAVPAIAGAPPPSARWVLGIATAVTIALVLNLYLTPGSALRGPRLFGAAPTREGLRMGALLALRLVAATAAVRGLRSAWPGERAADELARLLRPLERLRVPVREGRVMVGLALRFAPLMVAEARRIAALQDARAGSPPRSFRERLTRRRAAMIPTMVCALERAEQTALALEARHYRLRPLPPRARAGSGWMVAGIAIAGTALVWRS